VVSAICRQNLWWRSNKRYSVDEIAPVAYKMPEYMATHDSDSIFNPRQSPFSWGNNAEGTTFYEFLLSHPDRLKRFNVAMTTQEGALPVLGMFPFTSLLEKTQILQEHSS
jgi:hypothetical protein